MNWKLTGSRLLKLYEQLERVVLWAGAVLLLLLAIPPLHSLLHLPPEIVIAVLGLVLVAFLRALHGIEEELRSLVTRSQPTSKGVPDVYNYIDSLLARRSKWTADKRGRVEILGLSLFTTWPYLQGLLSSSTHQHCDITLCCLDPDYILTNPTIRPEWAEQARANINWIRTYAHANARILKQRDVVLRLHLYGFFPVIHGFCFDGEDILYSFLFCAGDGRAATPYDFYEHASPYDAEPRSTHYRELFKTWLDNAMRSPEVLASLSGVPAGNGGGEPGGKLGGRPAEAGTAEELRT